MIAQVYPAVSHLALVSPALSFSSFACETLGCETLGCETPGLVLCVMLPVCPGTVLVVPASGDASFPVSAAKAPCWTIHDAPEPVVVQCEAACPSDSDQMCESKTLP